MRLWDDELEALRPQLRQETADFIASLPARDWDPASASVEEQVAMTRAFSLGGGTSERGVDRTIDGPAGPLRLRTFVPEQADAVLFHIPSQELPRVLRELYATLKPGGVLFSSNPHGNNEEGWSGGRYGAFHDLATWRRYVSAAGFAELGHYYRPTGAPREQQPWLATLWRRPTA